MIGQRFPPFHDISSLSQACSLYESMGDARNAAAAACRDAQMDTLDTDMIWHDMTSIEEQDISPH